MTPHQARAAFAHRKGILFVGWGRAGKDTAAEYVGRVTGLGYGGSTSWAGKEHMAKVFGVHPMVAWERRHDNRQRWKDELDKLRMNDQTVLIRRCLLDGPVFAGVRDKAELLAAREQGLLRLVVWVHRYGVPEDPTVTFTSQDCDDIVANIGSLEYFYDQLDHLMLRHGLLIPASPTNDLHRE